MKAIRGISPITKQPFNKADQAVYGWMKGEGDLKAKFRHVNPFDYADITKEFNEFKKCNPELVEKPKSEVEKATFKALKESEIFSQKN